MYRKFFLSLVPLILAILGAYYYLTPKQPAPALTRDYLRQAYHQYSAYHEQYYDVDRYINTFPVEIYSLYNVQNLKFILEKYKFDYIKSELRASHRWEAYLTRYMAKYVRKGSQVVDVGAHIGTHTVYFAKLLDGSGVVYAFEPQMKIYLELNANLLANQAKNVKTYRYALGDKMGQIEMDKPDNNNEGGTSVGHGGDQADLITLDSLKLNNVSLIKIDVEGYEDHVLDGAVETIKQNKPVILCEIQGHAIPGHVTKAEKLKIKHTLAKLKALGYKTIAVAPSDYLALPLTKPN